MKTSIFRLQVSGFSSSRSGQAMTELMIGLVLVMVLVSGLLQIASMTRAHTDVMIEAREEAAELCMFDLGPGMDLLSDARLISDWDEGPDRRRLSRDDEDAPGDSSGFLSLVVEPTVSDPSGWDQIDSAPNNRLSRLHDDPMVISSFGLIKGSASESAQLDMLPAFRHLVYAADSIDVEATAWMTLCKGIY